MAVVANRGRVFAFSLRLLYTPHVTHVEPPIAVLFRVLFRSHCVPSYWDKCRRKNPDHMEEFLHPADLAPVTAPAADVDNDEGSGEEVPPVAAGKDTTCSSHLCVCLHVYQLA